MIDISEKPATLREAVAQSMLRVSPNTILLIKKGETPKGDPLQVAKIAAVQGAKNTSNLIPYCHPLPLTLVEIDFHIERESILSTVLVKAIHSTGVEMEALTGAAVASLTLYDMLKGIDKEMEIEWVRLKEKKGGGSQYPRDFIKQATAAIVVISDSTAQGERPDTSGTAIKEFLEERGAEVTDFVVVPDEEDSIVNAIQDLVSKGPDLVVTTGGTGIGPRDVTPEAVRSLLEREIPGISEAIRGYGQLRTPYACLSRTLAGTVGTTMILSLPGSPKAVIESLTAVFPALVHSLEMIRGEGH